MAKKQHDYFQTFQTLVDYSAEAAQSLYESFTDFDPSTLNERRDAMHLIEHNADEEKHVMMEKLAAEFVTPIEREDILQLANEMDEVTDKVEDVLIRIYMYNVQAIRPEALAFADVIKNCCTKLQVATKEFANFKKSATLHQCVVDVNTMEEEGDALYINSMRELYTTEKDPVQVLIWSEVYDKLEECCDACEHVANVMESIVMKNS
ncbi:MAG: DUF47 domain-containing protein [Oscillospiraceae bacterium]